MARGWIYILSNDAMPGLVKIGQSGKDPELRAQELYRTGVPGPFRVQYKRRCRDHARLERDIHAALHHARYNRQREFFRIEVPEAVQLVAALAGDPVRRKRGPGLSRPERWLRNGLVVLVCVAVSVSLSLLGISLLALVAALYLVRR